MLRASLLTRLRPLAVRKPVPRVARAVAMAAPGKESGGTRFELPQLPYAMNGLEPHTSERTLSFHYGKHHATYVSGLNAALEKPEYSAKYGAGMSLDDIVMASFKDDKADGPVFNNAGQARALALRLHAT